MDFIVKTYEGEFDIEAAVRLIGDDILIAIYGGEKPHIGAVAIAQPRPSLRDTGVIKSTASVFCFLSHREDVIAKTAGEKISAIFNKNTVVTAGIHWDNLSEEGINKIMKNCSMLVELIIIKLKGIH